MCARPDLLLSRAVLAALVVGAAACGGKSLALGYDDGRLASINPAEPVDMAAVRDRCSAPGGAEEPYVTDAAARAQLAGRWFVCETTGDPGMPIPSAIEFTADGEWYALVANDGGVYARASSSGGRYHTAKDISCCYPDTWVINFGAGSDPPSFFVTFRPGPLQMRWSPAFVDGVEGRPTAAHFVKG